MIKVKLHRGDYLRLKLNIYNSSKEYASVNFDEIYFTVKKFASYKAFIFQKSLTKGEIVKESDGIYVIELLPEDTDKMKFGDYAFDVELIENTTPIKQTFLGTLTLDEEVTWSSNEIKTEEDTND